MARYAFCLWHKGVQIETGGADDEDAARRRAIYHAIYKSAAMGGDPVGIQFVRQTQPASPFLNRIWQKVLGSASPAKLMARS